MLADMTAPNVKCKYCGNFHSHPIRTISLGFSVLHELACVVQQGGYKKVLLVADANTYVPCGKKIETLLMNHTSSFRTFVFDDKELIPDETSLGRLITASPADTDLIIGLGSGTINDLCRYAAFRTHIEYIIVATAPSMDGYASGVSPLIVQGLKTTYEATAPTAIIGDYSLLKTAPLIMHGAGMGDMLGKYTALCDWRLSHFVTNEYYCEWVAELTKKSVDKCQMAVMENPPGSDACTEALMEGLTGSGIAMSYAESSRPASGAEHHLSHFWEMMFSFANRPAVLHGIKVGIATLAVIKLHELLWNSEPDFEAAAEAAQRWNQTDYCIRMKEIYGSASAGILRQEEESGRNSSIRTIERIHFYKENWRKLMKIAKDSLPSYGFVYELLKRSGCPVSPQEVGIDRDMFRKGILYAKEVRTRYTVLQLVSDLNLLEGFADELTKTCF